MQVGRARECWPCSLESFSNIDSQGLIHAGRHEHHKKIWWYGAGSSHHQGAGRGTSWNNHCQLPTWSRRHVHRDPAEIPAGKQSQAQQGRQPAQGQLRIELMMIQLQGITMLHPPNPLFAKSEIFLKLPVRAVVLSTLLVPE